jgi:nucleoid DNA-binding protein
MEVVRKKRLDGQVAELLGKKTADVSRITGAFLREVIKALAKEGCVRLDGLGELKLSIRPLQRHYNFKRTSPRGGDSETITLRTKYYVRFKKASPLREAILAQHGPGATKEKRDGKVRRRRVRKPRDP